MQPQKLHKETHHLGSAILISHEIVLLDPRVWADTGLSSVSPFLTEERGL